MQDTIQISSEERYNACETSASAVTWPAIIAGSVAAIALSFVLLLLGSGFGLASVSPWPQAGASAVTFTVTGAIWLIIMQWLSSALGGYLTGRLRCKWAGTHNDEVFFRDTAHGFLAWVVATIFTAAFLASAFGTIVGGATQAATTVAAGAAAGAAKNMEMESNPDAYFVDSLFRSDVATQSAPQDGVNAEAARILIKGIKAEGVSDADKAYLSQLVASRTGLMPDDAAKRVDDVITQMNAAETRLRQDADTARKTAATISIFTAISMLIGAFVAAAAAALGGRCRDKY